MRLGAILLTASFVLAGSARAASTRCWIDQGAVVAAAAFGDIAGDFVIDVGAPVSRLHVTRADADGIEGKTVTRPLILAGRRLGAARLTVADLDALPQADTSIAGIIGADILARYPVTIAFAPCRLIWGASRRPRGSLLLAMTLAGDVPMIPAAITDGVNVRREPMVVATGRSETLVSDAALSRTPKAGSTPPVRLRAVQVGDTLLEQVPGGVAEAEPGSIGTGVWRRWSVMRVDWKRRRLDLADKVP